MDPLKPSKNPEQEHNFGNTDNSNQNPPIIIVDNENGHVCIRIEGSHTTASETDKENHWANEKENRNVKFEDELGELPEVQGKGSADTLNKDLEEQEDEEVAEENKSKENSQENENIITNTDEVPVMTKALVVKSDQLEKMKLRQQKTQQELQQIEEENKEIAERFTQIMEMFDSFTKNLDTFEIPSTSQDRTLTWLNERRPKSEILLSKDWTTQPRVHRSRFSDYYNQKEKMMKDKKENGLETDSKQSQAEQEKFSTGTAISNLELPKLPKPVQTLACQTSLDGRISNYDLSSVAASCGTSKTDMETSLNNYANADNACSLVPLSPPQPGNKLNKETPAKSTHESPSCIELTSLMVVDEIPRHPIHTIQIEAHNTPSSSDLSRRPLCQRFMSMISDFCGAVFLCLQVNRDCIFCLGFFVAFVVSASFLTAFFYRTLSMSSSLLQISAQQQEQARAREANRIVRVGDYHYYRHS